MQQPCQKCGYVSDRPTRFCRQCGARLFVENEATSATTRQYASQQTATPPANAYDAPYQSQLAQARSAQDSRSDNQPPDTSPFYRAPMAQNYPNYPANYQLAEAKKSGAWKWVLITLLCVVLVSGGIGVMVISAIRANRGAEPGSRTNEWPGSDAPLPPQAPLPPVAPLPPAPPPPASGELPAGLEQYKYPNAEVESSGSALGNEFAKMTTSDSVSKVRDFYKKQLGDPILKNKDEGGESVIFQVPGSPMIIITINQDEEDSDKTQINVLRTSFQIPKMN